jgi:hypothetical protein
MILGYGYPLASFAAGLKHDPHVIGVDAGSTDPGPYYLGAGESLCGAATVKRDLRPMIVAGAERNIPVIVGTSGGSGGEPHLERTFEILAEICHEEDVNPRVALIHAEQDKAMLIKELRAGRIHSLQSVPPLTEHDINRSTRIVGQMGVEPIQRAIRDGATVVLAGRSCDVSVFAAVPMMQGHDPGLTMHAAKIIECGAHCAEPTNGLDSILATINNDHFVLTPLNPQQRITRVSAAAHSLYEQDDPARIVEPLGSIDVATADFEELSSGSIRVSGSRFEPAGQYSIKLEGAALAGYRAISICGVRDPTAIANIDQLLQGSREHLADVWGISTPDHPYEILFRLYGRDGVMGANEPCRELRSHELGLVIEVVAETQTVAGEICSLVRSTLLHFDYPGRLNVGGNLAFPFSPHNADWGPVYEFSAYHRWEVDDGLAPFPIEMRAI